MQATLNVDVGWVGGVGTATSAGSEGVTTFIFLILFLEFFSLVFVGILHWHGIHTVAHGSPWAVLLQLHRDQSV